MCSTTTPHLRSDSRKQSLESVCCLYGLSNVISSYLIAVLKMLAASMLLGKRGLEELTYIYGQWQNTEQYAGFSLSVFFVNIFLSSGFLCIYLHFHYSFWNSMCIRKQMSDNPTLQLSPPLTNSHIEGGGTLSMKTKRTSDFHEFLTHARGDMKTFFNIGQV